MAAETAVRQYGTHKRQQVTVHMPRPASLPEARSPAVIVVHGGYWAQQSGLGDWPSVLASQGWVVFAPTYRLNSDAVWPAQRDDLLACVEWVLAHAGEFGADPDRICALGSSAGGHLAVQAAMFACDSIRAVAALSAPLSPYRAYNEGADPMGPWAEKRRRLREEARRLAGCEPDREDADSWQQWTDLVCYQHSTGDEPPMLLAYYTNDLVTAEHGLDLRTHEMDRGAGTDSVTLIQVSGLGHGMSLMEAPGISEAVVGFLADHASLPPGS